ANGPPPQRAPGTVCLAGNAARAPPSPSDIGARSVGKGGKRRKRAFPSPFRRLKLLGSAGSIQPHREPVRRTKRSSERYPRGDSRRIGPRGRKRRSMAATNIAIRGQRSLLKQIREALAGGGPAQTRLDMVVRIIARSMVAEVCSLYMRRAFVFNDTATTE